MSAVCNECGASPCYALCPTQDPYAGPGGQAREHADYEAGLFFQRTESELDLAYEAYCDKEAAREYEAAHPAAKMHEPPPVFAPVALACPCGASPVFTDTGLCSACDPMPF